MISQREFVALLERIKRLEEIVADLNAETVARKQRLVEQAAKMRAAKAG